MIGLRKLYKYFLDRRMTFFREAQPWGFTDYEISEDSHVSFFTKIQKVDFITNPHFGRMLFLDNVLQSTTSDEQIYHEAFVELGMRSISRNILIAGGAEGGVAREVFKRPKVNLIKMVDWDIELVEHCLHKEKFNISTFADKRLSYVNKNIVDFYKDCQYSFDTVFIDLLDVTNDEELEDMQKIIASVSVICVKGGSVLVANIGRNKKYAEKLAAVKGEVVAINIPSFQEPWYIIKICL